MPLRLLYASPPLERPGGVTRSLGRITESLRNAGHAVVVCAPDLALFPGDTRATGDTFRFGPRSPGTLLDDHAAALVAAAGLARPDLLVGYYGSTAAVSAALAARRLGLPSITCLRGNDIDRDLGDPELHARVAVAVREAAAVTAVSREMVRKVEAAFGVAPVFIPNAVDTTRFYPDPEAARALRDRLRLDDRPVLAMFGEIKEKRGVERLAAAGPALAAYQVLIVGRVRPEARPRVPPAARCIEYLHDDDALRAAYSLCDVVVQPSTRDGMPNVVLEAMACERVVVASPVGGLPDLIEHGRTGLLCATDDAFRAALEELLAAPRPELGRAARAAVPRPEQERDAFLSVFQAAIRRYAASSAPA